MDAALIVRTINKLMDFNVFLLGNYFKKDEGDALVLLGRVIGELMY